MPCRAFYAVGLSERIPRRHKIMMEIIKHHIGHFIQENFLFSHATDLSESDSFLDSGIIDSTGILELIDFLGEKYGITVKDEEMIPENLDSIKSVSEYVLRKLNIAEAPNGRVRMPEMDEHS